MNTLKVGDLVPNFSCADEKGTIHNLEDYKAAIADCTKAIDINPKHVEAYSIRGTSKYNLENYEGAIADYTKIIDINPSHVEAHYNRSYSKFHLGDYKGADEDTLRAQKIGLDDFSNLLKK